VDADRSHPRLLGALEAILHKDEVSETGVDIEGSWKKTLLWQFGGIHIIY
jgi:hypothetical protein